MPKTNKQTESPTTAAERVLAELEARRVALVERGAELAETRKRVAYAAHVNHDPEARRPYPKSRHWYSPAQCPLCAKSGLVHCNRKSLSCKQRCGHFEYLFLAVA